MTQNLLSPEITKIADDICFLVDHARCPTRQGDLLHRWSSKVRRGMRAAYREEILLEVVDALVTLSYANAAFSRSLAPPFHRGRPEIDIEDRGGYFAGRAAITTLIYSVPINKDLQLSLAKRAVNKTDQVRRSLEALIPLC